MNENLEEIYAQAYLETVEHMNRQSELSMEEHFEEVLTSKFSAGIINRCIDLCESIAAGKDAEAIQEGIAKHFGLIR